MELIRQKTRGGMTLRQWSEQAPKWSGNTSHGGLELGWADIGALAYRIGRKEHPASSGMVMVVPEGVEHRSWLSLGGAARSVHVGPAVIAPIEAELGSRLVFTALTPTLVHSPALVARLSTALDALSQNAQHVMAELAVLSVLQAGLSQAAREKLRDWRILRALEYLFSHSAEKVEVDTLAAVAGLSRAHFSRAFETRVGESPYQFVLTLRLEAAARLLAAGERVTTAALVAGFTDLSRFGQQFRRRFGVAPRDWRQLPKDEGAYTR
jgi:AraC-like DNA-binding protein